MDLIILVDNTPHLFERTINNLSKLEIIKAMSIKIVDEVQRHKNTNISFYDSDIYLKQNFESLSSINNIEHIKNEIQDLKISYTTNFIESLLFLLSFQNFAKLTKKCEDYSGLRDLNNITPVLILVLGSFTNQTEKNMNISNLIEKLKWDQNLLFIDVVENENIFNDIFDLARTDNSLKLMIFKLLQYKHIFLKISSLNDCLFLLDILNNLLHKKIIKLSFFNIDKKLRNIIKPVFLENYFEKFLVSSIYQDFNFVQNFISNFTFGFQKQNFALPEDFFLLKKENIIKDLFLSIDYYNFPVYYIDLEYFFIKKNNLFFECNKLNLFQFQIKDEFADYLYLVKEKFGKHKNIYFPIYYRNFNFNILNIFGLYHFNFENPNNFIFEIEYFPVSFFEIHHYVENNNSQLLNNCFQILPQPQKTIYKNLFKQKNIKLKIENIVISVKNEPFYPIIDFNLFFEHQNSIFNSILETKIELNETFQKSISKFQIMHKLQNCKICFSKDKKAKKKLVDLNKSFLDLNFLDNINKTTFPLNSNINDETLFKKLYEPSFQKKFKKFGNPFKYTIKNNHQTKFDFNLQIYSNKNGSVNNLVSKSKKNNNLNDFLKIPFLGDDNEESIHVDGFIEEGILGLKNLNYENDLNLRKIYNHKKKKSIKQYNEYKKYNEIDNLLKKLNVDFNSVQGFKIKQDAILNSKYEKQEFTQQNGKENKKESNNKIKTIRIFLDKESSLKDLKNGINLCVDNYDNLIEIFIKIKNDKKQKLLFLENPESLLDKTKIYHPNFLKKLKLLLNQDTDNYN